MAQQFKPPGSEPAIRLVMMQRDTNAQGTIFGGVILSLIDQAAYVEAMRQAHHRYVTVALREVEFHQPVFVGDVLSLYAETIHAGRTSLTIDVRVAASRRDDPDENVKVTKAEVVMVAVDEDGKVVGHAFGGIEQGGTVGWILNFAVIAHYRRTGTGTRLLEQLISELGAAGAETVRATAETHNGDAFRLYQKLGFSEVDTAINYYGDGTDRLIFERMCD